MTRRGGKEASVSSRGTGEDERQPVMARLADRWRRSNLVKLVTLRKGNHDIFKNTVAYNLGNTYAYSRFAS